MTAVSATPPALEQYLRRATAGLPPAKRQEVWDELEEHVYCRAEQLEWQGAAPEQALAQALAELGPPLRVSAGMNGVHNMPKLIAVGVVGMLAVSAGLYALAGGSGRVMTLPVLTEGPLTRCVEKSQPQPDLKVVHKEEQFICYQNDAKTQSGAFVSFGTVKKAVEAMGGKVTTLPNGDLNLAVGNTSSQFWPDFRLDGEGYTQATKLLSALITLQAEDESVPISIRAMDNPEIQIGDMVIRLVGNDKKASGESLYSDIVISAVRDLYFEGEDLKVGFSYETHTVPEYGPARTIRTPLKAGEVVMVLALQEKRNNVFQSATAVVDAEGKIQVHGPLQENTLRFVTDPKQLSPLKVGQPWPVLLVKMSNTPLNNLKSGIFLPKP